MMDHEKKARELFREGYNCAQAVFLAFSDLTGMDEKCALALSSSFGGGMGRLREVCGAVSGAFMAMGVLYGYTDPSDHKAKAAHYERIQEVARRFREKNSSIICRELLALGPGPDEPTPEKRTEEYYHRRPCEDYVGIAAAILDEYISENPVG